MVRRDTEPRVYRRPKEKSYQETDCVAGHVGLELRNVVANYPIEGSCRFPGIRPNPVTETIRG